MKTISLFLAIVLILACNKEHDAKEKIESTTHRDELPRSPESEYINIEENLTSGVARNEIEFLENFYNEYVIEFQKATGDTTGIDKVLDKYCSQNLINKLAAEDIDYDPFLNAQDINTAMLETFAIKKDNTRDDIYILTYRDGYENRTVSIRLQVIEVGGGFKINEILE